MPVPGFNGRLRGGSASAQVVRSCPEMCRFCHASYMTLPFRPADVEGSLLPLIEEGLGVTRRLGLLGASVTQHPEFDKLLDHLMQPQFEARPAPAPRGRGPPPVTHNAPARFFLFSEGR